MTSQAPNPQNQSRRTVPWCEPSYRNEDMPSLERVDRVHTRRGVGGMDSGIGNPPRPMATHVLQWGRVNMVGLYCQVPVGGSGVSTRDVSFPPMLAVEGNTLGFPGRLSGASSPWSPSNSSSRLGRNIQPETKSGIYNFHRSSSREYEEFHRTAFW